MKLNTDLADYAVIKSSEKGVTYSEARLQAQQEMGVLLKNGEPEPAIITMTGGLAMRISYKGGLVFGYTNAMDRRSIDELIDKLIKQAKAGIMLFRRPINFSKQDVSIAKWEAEERERMENLNYETLLAKAVTLDRICKSLLVKQRIISIESNIEEKYFVNSEGTMIRSRVPRASFFGIITAHSEGNVVQRVLQHGEVGGIEAFERMNVGEKISKEVKIMARILDKSVKIEEGKRNVVVSPEIAGIMAHESVGHPSEADRILGREAAQAGESYIGKDEMGIKIGSEEACVSDDPTIPHSYGFYLFDDEGVGASKRVLLNRGRISEFLHNRETSVEYGTTSNASARASAYDREPIIRMANTYVEPGDADPQELLAETKDGVYIKSFMEWNIDDRRLNQRYVGHEAYIIKNGAVGLPIRNLVLEVNTPTLWSSLERRANDLEYNSATCGKGDPEQGIPVWTGGPHLKFGQLMITHR